MYSKEERIFKVATVAHSAFVRGVRWLRQLRVKARGKSELEAEAAARRPTESARLD